MISCVTSPVAADGWSSVKTRNTNIVCSVQQEKENSQGMHTSTKGLLCPLLSVTEIKIPVSASKIKVTVFCSQGISTMGCSPWRIIEFHVENWRYYCISNITFELVSIIC